LHPDRGRCPRQAALSLGHEADEKVQLDTCIAEREKTSRGGEAVDGGFEDRLTVISGRWRQVVLTRGTLS
jgi:hypothetical protein